MATRWAPWLLIALLGLLFFAELARHPDQTLYSDYSDLLTLHLPTRRFLVRSWQETGQLPLWCPYNFAGMPFIHDLQASAFYPPHWPLLLLPEERLGAAMSWLIVLHVIVAGWAMYAYARHQGLSVPGALTAGIGFMFAGKWLMHLLAGGHYNMVPLAWLPLVLLWLEQAIHRGSLLRATWAGVAFALLVLGAYPYVTLYAGLFIALWTFGLVREVGHDGIGGRRACLRWLGYGAWTAVVAVGLGAVQLLPGLEASASASRSAGVGISPQLFLDGLRSVVGLMGPPLSDEPNGWENRAGLGILWVALAILAPSVGGPRVRYQAGVCLVLVGFALGGAAAVQWLPGFRLFRLPSRMFLVAALPLALLAGVTVNTLVGQAGADPVLRRRCRRLLLKITAVVLVLAAVFIVTLLPRTDIQPRFHLYWATLLLTIPGACWLLGDWPADRMRLAPSIIWIVLLLIDTCSLTAQLVVVRSDAEIYTPSACVRSVAANAEEHGRALDFNPQENAANHTPLWPGLPAVVGVEPVRGFNPIDIVRYKEYLQFIADDDQPLHALDQMWTGPVLGTFPIRNQSLANLLGIRYLLQPSDLPLAATVPDEAARACWDKGLEDRAATTFNFIAVQPAGRDCGLQPLPPYTVYENRHTLPRAFVVAEAAPLPARAEVLAVLKSTDFTRRVLLEDFEERPTPSASAGTAITEAFASHALICKYQPNEVDIEVSAAGPGYLVLTDIWFPGWTCSVDGQPARIHRANFLFRAVALPGGARHVVFTFAPVSYAKGKMLSGAMALLVLAMTLLAAFVSFSHQPRVAQEGRKVDAVLC
jgi:hypothetical protein